MGFMMINAPMSAAAQITVPVIQRPIPMTTHRQIVGTAMLGAEFDDRIAIRPNRLPIGLARFGLQYDPCPFWHAHEDLPLRRFPAKFLASRLSGQSVSTAFRVPMLRVNLLCYGSGTDGSQTLGWRKMDSNF